MEVPFTVNITPTVDLTNVSVLNVVYDQTNYNTDYYDQQVATSITAGTPFVFSDTNSIDRDSSADIITAQTVVLGLYSTASTDPNNGLNYGLVIGYESVAGAAVEAAGVAHPGSASYTDGFIPAYNTSTAGIDSININSQESDVVSGLYYSGSDEAQAFAADLFTIPYNNPTDEVVAADSLTDPTMTLLSFSDAGYAGTASIFQLNPDAPAVPTPGGFGISATVAGLAATGLFRRRCRAAGL